MECEGISTPISASPIEVCTIWHCARVMGIVQKIHLSPIEVCMALCICNGHSPEDSFILFDLLLFSIRYSARVISRATTLGCISKDNQEKYLFSVTYIFC
jgi:hypothetical protein